MDDLAHLARDRAEDLVQVERARDSAAHGQHRRELLLGPGFALGPPTDREAAAGLRSGQSAQRARQPRERGRIGMSAKGVGHEFRQRPLAPALDCGSRSHEPAHEHLAPAPGPWHWGMHASSGGSAGYRHAAGGA